MNQFNGNYKAVYAAYIFIALIIFIMIIFIMIQALLEYLF